MEVKPQCTRARKRKTQKNDAGNCIHESTGLHSPSKQPKLMVNRTEVTGIFDKIQHTPLLEGTTDGVSLPSKENSEILGNEQVDLLTLSPQQIEDTLNAMVPAVTSAQKEITPTTLPTSSGLWPPIPQALPSKEFALSPFNGHTLPLNNLQLETNRYTVVSRTKGSTDRLQQLIIKTSGFPPVKINATPVVNKVQGAPIMSSEVRGATGLNTQSIRHATSTTDNRVIMGTDAGSSTRRINTQAPIQEYNTHLVQAQVHRSDPPPILPATTENLVKASSVALFQSQTLASQYYHHNTQDKPTVVIPLHSNTLWPKSLLNTVLSAVETDKISID